MPPKRSTAAKPKVRRRPIDSIVPTNPASSAGIPGARAPSAAAAARQALERANARRRRAHAAPGCSPPRRGAAMARAARPPCPGGPQALLTRRRALPQAVVSCAQVKRWWECANPAQRSSVMELGLEDVVQKVIERAKHSESRRSTRQQRPGEATAGLEAPAAARAAGSWRRRGVRAGAQNRRTAPTPRAVCRPAPPPPQETPAAAYSGR
jgi:hypothetical protein